jgi:hypothetical protein
MFGFKGKKRDDGRLPIFVHTVRSDAVFELAGKVWQANARLMRDDPANGKQFMHFTYTKPACTVWLEHDANRGDACELVLRWHDPDATEVFTVSPGQVSGDVQRATEVLQRMLTIPSVVPAQSNTQE